MEPSSIQLQLFQHIKSGLPPHLAMVDEIAGTLNISIDSAYRRIRGETPISLEELQKLCTHYNISLDKFFHLQSGAIMFNGSFFRSSEENSFEDWLKGILTFFQMFNNYGKKHLYFLMKDIPPFIIILIPELARFKFFFYMNSILNKSLGGVRFALDDPQYNKFDCIAKEISDLYLKIPTTEIWNVVGLEGFLKQIAFYRDAGSFKNPSDVMLLYTKLEEMMNHLERQAELGLKFNIGEKPTAASSEYRMYVNELILGNNNILVELDDTRITFVNYSLLHIVYSSDVRFNNSMRENIDTYINKSTLISKSGEKERVRFFNQLREKIYQYRDSN